jgi:hypothetical protein
VCGRDSAPFASATQPDAGNELRPITMKKVINLVVEDDDLIELMRILMDDDADGALAYLKIHFKDKARDLLEGG